LEVIGRMEQTSRNSLERIPRHTWASPLRTSQIYFVSSTPLLSFLCPRLTLRNSIYWSKRACKSQLHPPDSGMAHEISLSDDREDANREHKIFRTKDWSCRGTLPAYTRADAAACLVVIMQIMVQDGQATWPCHGHLSW
jgi:hypothetical protein